ncbi:MAG: hypothetical protein ABI193_25550 [Minicystis sp.]
MHAVEEGFTYFFYGATILALVFFIHKVLWLVHYKRIQGALVREAVTRLREGNEAALAEWEDFARTCWANALGKAEVANATTFIRRVEEGLGRLRSDLKSSRKSIEELLTHALSAGTSSPKRGTIFSLRRLTGSDTEERLSVEMDLRFSAVTLPRPPDKRLYELKVASRYSLLRRALVFFSGAADVVYSSQHVAMMSQNVHLPTSVLVRRLSLVFLVLAVVAIDIVFGVRTWLGAVINGWINGPPPAAGQAAKQATEGGVLGDHLGSILAFGAWMAAYGVIYLLLYFLIRRRYQVSVRRLREMMVAEGERMRGIHKRHHGDLLRWGRAYGRSLDSAVEITLRHAETLIDHVSHRLRRRVAGSALFDGAKAIADSLFLRLPESRGEVQDVATLQKHSFRHYLWPRAEEMSYQVRFAEYRAAWQHLELSMGDLRREQPDPNQAHELWRSAVAYATIFAPLVPSGTAESLRHAYAQMVTESVSHTDKDLADLDRRLGELERGLSDQLECARALVESKVELANQQVQGAVAEMAAEIISVREQARLEAMAFEI